MNNNQSYDEPKELMSDSLQETLVAEETQNDELENIFILASIVFEDNTLLMGNMLGIEFGENPKLDLKVLTQKSFKIIGDITLMQKKVKLILLTLGDEIIKISGPFKISCFKVVEMDYQNRACILAFDLLKDHI